MDEIAYFLRDQGIPDQAAYALELSLVVDGCRWTGGTWAFSGRDRRAWNKLQNTPRDIALLSDYLVRLYRTRRRDATSCVRRPRPRDHEGRMPFRSLSPLGLSGGQRHAFCCPFLEAA